MPIIINDLISMILSVSIFNGHYNQPMFHIAERKLKFISAEI